VEVAAAAGALIELSWAEETLAIALTLQGDPAAALAILDAAVPRARELRLDQLGFLLVAQAGALSYTRPDVEAIFAEAEAEAVAPAPDLLVFTTSIRADIALQHGRWDEAIACSVCPTRWPPRCPAAPRWTGPATCLGAGRGLPGGRGRAVLKAGLPDLARWYPRPVMVAAGRALLDGDADGVDAAIAATPGRCRSRSPPCGSSPRSSSAARPDPLAREAVDIYEASGATATERARAAA
jgi:hypothetical protein